MSYIVDLTGKKIGRLTVLEQAGRDKHHYVIWKCRCDCGNEVMVSSHYLAPGRTKSCGCLRLKNYHNLPNVRIGKNTLKIINDAKKHYVTDPMSNKVNVKAFALAVLLQAIDDWRRLCNGHVETRYYNFAELRQFFKQSAEPYFAILDLGITPKWLLQKLEKERMEKQK